MTCETYQDLVAAHVDDVLVPAERQEVEQHLGTCERCQRLFAAETRFHAAFVARQFVVPVPVEVERRLRIALAAEQASQPSLRERVVVFLSWPRLTLGMAAAGLLIALLIPRFFSSASEPAWFTQATNYYRAATEGRIPFAYRTDDPQELEAAFNHSRQLDFATHVIDLRPAGYHIRGGQVVRIEDHPTALVLYGGKDGSIVCLRQRGMAPQMPAGSEGGKSKYVYTHGGYTISFVQFPEHFCMLISRLPREVFRRDLGL
jgi:anti-sigma factor RsiW